MAILTFEFGRNMKHTIKYVTKDRSPDDEFDSSGCSRETAFEEFQAVRELHKKTRANPTLLLTQSWSTEESESRSPKEFLQMGKELAEKLFPGHQYIIHTHTDTDNIHNHIVLNTVHAETGKVIQNKKFWPGTKTRFVDYIRNINDQICLSHGLSIVNEKAKSREQNKPYRVQKLERFQKDSWVSSLTQTCDFASRYSTSYDEYVGILSEFGITARIENRNVSYLYPGQARAKRGSKLGRRFDKKGLETRFEENDKLFLKYPEIRNEVRGKINELHKSPDNILKDENGQILELNSKGDFVRKNYSKHTPIKRRDGTKTSQSLGYEGSLIPDGELRKARKSILEFCKTHKIALTKNDKGETVLKGREHIVIDEFECTNVRSKEKGNLIKFVAAYQRTSELRAISYINNNQKLLLLEHIVGPSKPLYTSFYFPKKEEDSAQKAIGVLQSILTQHGSDPGMASYLVNHKKAQLNIKGIARLFSENKDMGAFEFVQDESKKWNAKPKGAFDSPFYAKGTQSKNAFVFLDPFSVMKKESKDLLLGNVSPHGVLALMEPSELVVSKYLASNPSVSQISFVTSSEKKFDKPSLDFFNNLKAKYSQFGISVHEVSFEKLALEREHGMER